MNYTIKTNEEGRCLRECPHRQKILADVQTFGGEYIKVGSSFCFACEFNGNTDRKATKDGKVVCLYEELSNLEKGELK